MMLRALLSAASALTLAACASGPDYVRPAPPAASTGPLIANASPAIAPRTPVPERWWHLYDDPVLDGLVVDALAANTDVRQAVARVERARAVLREIKVDRLPQLNTSASAQYGRLPRFQGAPGTGAPGNGLPGGGLTGAGGGEDWQVNIGANVGYEGDLFGRVRRNVEAARGDVGAADADLRAVRVVVVADTIDAYASAAAAAARIAVAERIVALLDRSLQVTMRREEVGLTTKLDTARIAALRNQRQAQVPSLAAERDAALFRLATLTGRAPAALPPAAAMRKATLRLERPIPVGDGQGLIARRPDVEAAERRLAASTARIGVATAELYPRISLGGSVGSIGQGFGNIFGANPLTWLLGPLINWSLTDAARARARIEGAEADTRGALAAFDGSVLTALRETEIALSAYARALDRRTALQGARDAAATAAGIVRAQQREGQVDSLALLDAERTFADAEADLALIDAQIATAQIDLFRALGGGW